MNKVFEINVGFEKLEPFISNVKERFFIGGTVLYEGRNTLKSFYEGGEKIVIKSFQVPHMINRFSYSHLRKSKAARSYLYSIELLNRGILTPDPIAYVEYHKHGLLFESFYFSRELKDAFEIRSVFSDPEYPDRENIFKEFAAFTYRLHLKGVYHRDYSAGNILIREEKNNYQFYLVDVNRLNFCKFTDRLRMKSLSRLGGNEADNKKIMEYYLSLSS